MFTGNLFIKVIKENFESVNVRNFIILSFLMAFMCSADVSISLQIKLWFILPAERKSRVGSALQLAIKIRSLSFLAFSLLILILPVYNKDEVPLIYRLSMLINCVQIYKKRFLLGAGSMEAVSFSRRAYLHKISRRRVLHITMTIVKC